MLVKKGLFNVGSLRGEDSCHEKTKPIYTAQTPWPDDTDTGHRGNGRGELGKAELQFLLRKGSSYLHGWLDFRGPLGLVTGTEVSRNLINESHRSSGRYSQYF